MAFLLCLYQVVRLFEVFPHGTGFVLVFEYMLSDLSEVLRNSNRPLTEVGGLNTGGGIRDSWDPLSKSEPLRIE